jgi:hypothetical protein
MHLFFAGLARNCEQEVSGNINVLVQIANHIAPDSFTIYICENDSTDQTRDMILGQAARCPHVIPVLLDGLTSEIKELVPRISHCRNLLLEKIKTDSFGLLDALYIPIDLDSSIALSLDCSQFKKAILFLLESQWNAVFPFSKPYYYDVYALRAKNWCSYNSLLKMRQIKVKGTTANLLGFLWFVSRHQHRWSSYLVHPIPVESAFGGLGIYRLDSVIGSHYPSPYEEGSAMACEHVVFNFTIQMKCILPWFQVQAPAEHIRLKTISKMAFMTRLFNSCIDDAVSIADQFWKARSGRTAL